MACCAISFAAKFPLFQGGELYASASLLGGGVFFIVETSGADPRVGALAGAATVVGLRLAALRLG